MRMPIRPALSAYAGPTPLPVVPMRRAPSFASAARSSTGWYGMMRWAFFEMKRLPSRLTPRWTSDSISSMSDAGSTTTPHAMTQRQLACRMPDGIVCRTYFSRPTTTVCPALLPPAKRTATLTCGVRMSTTLPFPSSPHCVPITTMFGMSAPASRQNVSREIALGRLQHGGHRQHPLGAGHQVDREHLARGRPLAADDQGVTHAVRARIGERLREPAAHDVARDRRAATAQPAREGQGGGLFSREVDDEEIRARERHVDALRRHHAEGPPDVESEAHRRTLVAEAAQHVIVPAAARDGCTVARHVRHEVEPGVVVEAAHFSEVEQHGIAEAVDLEQPIDLGEVFERARRPLVARESAGAVQDFLAADEGGQREQGLTHRGRRRGIGDQTLERGGVLASERRAELPRGGFVPELVEEPAEEVEMTEI